jgi:hypothetical protein
MTKKQIITLEKYYRDSDIIDPQIYEFIELFASLIDKDFFVSEFTDYIEDTNDEDE